MNSVKCESNSEITIQMPFLFNIYEIVYIGKREFKGNKTTKVILYQFIKRLNVIINLVICIEIFCYFKFHN